MDNQLAKLNVQILEKFVHDEEERKQMHCGPGLCTLGIEDVCISSVSVTQIGKFYYLIYNKLIKMKF